MDITSFIFLAFVGISLFIYWLVPKKVQWLILLADSLIFYFVTVKPYTFIYVLISVFTVWGAALYFKKADSQKKKRLALALTIVLNVSILVMLKYTNMFIGTFNYWTGKSTATVNWIAPLAVSYYTLSLISYLVDCYGEALEPEKNPFKLLLFTTYFPQMVSGPICRYSQTGAQLFEEHRFDYDRVLSGMRRTLWGLLKKVVVADYVAMIANVMFDDPDLFSGPWVLVAACVFMVQLFFDFSGCMDIVIGVSKCFGIILPENFNVPFLSKSVQEFWGSRWHITLGAWLKDYVMYPISRTKLFKRTSKSLKNKLGKSGQKIPYYAAMFVVWTLMGIWHGSSWKYMIGEGWFFWIVIVAGQVFEPVSKKLKFALHIKDENFFWNAFQVARTFLLVSIGNIAFRADSLAQTFYMYRRAFVWNGIKEQLHGIRDGMSGFGGEDALIIVCILGILQIICDFRQYTGKNNQEIVTKRLAVVRWAIYLNAIFIVIFYQISGETAFIYFQF